MQSTRSTHGVVCGLTLLFACGCHTYTPYGWGGYYGGVYNTPPSGIGPQGGPQLGAPAPMVTPGVPSYAAPGSGQLPGRPNGSARNPQSDAPPFQPGREAGNSSAETSSSQKNRVPPPIHLEPDYSYEEEPSSSDSGNSGGTTPSPFQQEGASLQRLDEGPRLAAVAEESAAEESTGEDDFVLPLEAEAAPETIQQAAGETAEAPDPYDYEPEYYRWLRGKVDFDEVDQTWNIIYSLNPDDEDRYGGSITLNNHPELSKLRDGDVALVEGRIDPDSLDRNGKPKYQITNVLGPLKPKQEVTVRSE